MGYLIVSLVLERFDCRAKHSKMQRRLREYAQTFAAGGVNQPVIQADENAGGGLSFQRGYCSGRLQRVSRAEGMHPQKTLCGLA